MKPTDRRSTTPSLESDSPATSRQITRTRSVLRYRLEHIPWQVRGVPPSKTPSPGFSTIGWLGRPLGSRAQRTATVYWRAVEKADSDGHASEYHPANRSEWYFALRRRQTAEVSPDTIEHTKNALPRHGPTFPPRATRSLRLPHRASARCQPAPTSQQRARKTLPGSTRSCRAECSACNQHQPAHFFPAQPRLLGLSHTREHEFPMTPAPVPDEIPRS